MALKKDIPKSVFNHLTAGGIKIWQTELAEMIKEPVLPHYAMACNALAEYNKVKDEIARMEAEGKNVLYTENENGTMSVHPLQSLLEKARRAFGDEAKRCNLTKDMITQAEKKNDILA